MYKHIITSYIWKHKDFIRIGKKTGLLKLVKTPIGALITFLICENAHELDESDMSADK